MSERIDDILRDGLRNQRTDFEEKDWVAMEAMLDKRRSRVGGFLLSWRGAAVGLLIIGLLSTFMIINNTNQSEVSATDPSVQDTEISSTTEQAESKAPAAIVDELEKPASGEKQIMDESAVAATSASVASNEITNNEYAATSFTAIDNAPQETITEIAPIEMRETMSTDYLASLSAEKIADSNEEPQANVGENIPGIELTPRTKSGLELGLAVAPEMNVVEGSRFGYTAGLTLSYPLSNRFSLQTGVFYSYKSYEEFSSSPIANFVPPPSLSTTLAEFQLIEIPLMLRYSFSTRGRWEPFISAGMSVYFPTKETYTYYDEPGPPSGPTLTAGDLVPDIVLTSYQAGGIEDFSVGNNVIDNSGLKLSPYWGIAKFSAGTSFRAGPRLSFDLAVKADLPLTDMGIESKRINTYGVMAGARIKLW